MTLISAVLIFKDNFKWLPLALAQLQQQSMERWEVIVVNQGTNDRNIEKSLRSIKHVRYIPAPGVSRQTALNLALRKAKGEYFINLPLKCELSRHAFSRIKKIAERLTDQSAVIITSPPQLKPFDTESHKHTYIHRLHQLNHWFPYSMTFFATKRLKETVGFRSDNNVDRNIMPEFRKLLDLIEQYDIHIDDHIYTKYVKESEIDDTIEGYWAMKKLLVTKLMREFRSDYSAEFNNERYQYFLKPKQYLPMPKVTILSAVYNEEKNITLMLDSIRLQDYGNLQVIIVTDGATDSTPQIIDEYIATYEIHHFMHIRLMENVGKSKAMNEGLRHATGAYVLELDGDDWIDPDCIGCLVAIMQQSSANTGYLYGNRRVFREIEGTVRYSRVDEGRAFGTKYEFLQSLRPYGPRFYKREALLKIHGWPVNYPSEGRMYEDFVLLTHLVDHCEFLYAPTLYYNIVRKNASISKTKSSDFFWETLEPVIRSRLEDWGNQYSYTKDTENKKLHLEKKS